MAKYRKNSAGRGNTSAQNRFAQVPEVTVQRSTFDRSCGLKTTFDAGYLVPIFVDEALPGDTFNMRFQSFARMATPIYPIMDNLKMDFFFFAVPIRLIWDNWEKMNGAQDNPGDSTDFLVPQMTAPVGGHLELSLSDYLGIPTKEDITHSSLWHRAYSLVFNEWFRHQDIRDSVVVDTDDGPDDPADYVLQRREKRHDYFTSCLPFPQKGPDVELPLGTSAPLQGAFGSGGVPTFDIDDLNNVPLRGTFPASGANLVGPASASTAVGDVTWDTPNLNLTGVTVDLTAATASTINALRESFQIQRMFERDARGGTRYTEVLRSHFGVISPDQRLQRPEYLGGGSTPININPIHATSRISGQSILGETSAVVTSAANIGFVKSFVEHCVVIGLVSVRADLTYQQGLERMFSRRTRFDFAWPALAHLGEQEVLSKEIFADGSANDDDVFGYQERFAEYRYKPSKITGQFRSNAATPLDSWHVAQEFASRPLLNESFMEEDPPIDRVVAVPSEPHFLFDSFAQFRCTRALPTYSVPGMIDHF